MSLMTIPMYYYIRVLLIEFTSKAGEALKGSGYTRGSAALYLKMSLLKKLSIIILLTASLSLKINVMNRLIGKALCS